MARNRWILWVLLAIVLMLLAAPVMAQTRDVSNIQFEDVLEALKPRKSTALLFDILLYLIFFIGFINQFMIPDKQIAITIMNFMVLGFAIAAKLLIDVQKDGGVYYPSAMFEPGDFPVFIMNVGMLVLPLLMAGGLRSVKGKPSRAIYTSIIMALLGGAYFFLFWATEQRQLSEAPQPGDDMEGVGALLVLMTFSASALRVRYAQLKRFFRRED